MLLKMTATISVPADNIDGAAEALAEWMRLKEVASNLAVAQIEIIEGKAKRRWRDAATRQQAVARGKRLGELRRQRAAAARAG